MVLVPLLRPERCKVKVKIEDCDGSASGEMAVQAIRRMRGGAQSHLMLGADGNAWVVKFQNNPQHIRVLANELIATRLAAAVGLTVPGRCGRSDGVAGRELG